MDQSVSPSQIVLAEDNPADVRLVREALSEHRVAHDLHVIPDGDLALKFIERLDGNSTIPCPVLFLLDLHLPKKNGREIVARLQSSRCVATPIVVFSAPGEPDNQQLVAAGVHFFQKQTTLSGFLSLGQLVKTVIESSKGT